MVLFALLIFIAALIFMIIALTLSLGEEIDPITRRRLSLALIIPIIFCCLTILGFYLVNSGLLKRAINPHPEDLLVGEWECAPGVEVCPQGVVLNVGGVSWNLSPQLIFSKEGRLSQGMRSEPVHDGTVTSGDITCYYRLIDENNLRLDCGAGTGDFLYQISGELLTISNKDILLQLQRLKNAP